MRHRNISLIVLILGFFIPTFSLQPAAQAKLISTESYLSVQRSGDLEQVQAFLAQDEVREQLVTLGVDPELVDQRVNMMTADELAQVQHHINDLPAGGDALAIIGAVFLVLLILELVGVTNIFNKL